MTEEELYKQQNSQGMNVFDIMEFHGMTEAVKIIKDVIATKNEEIKKLQEQQPRLDDDQVRMLGLLTFNLQDKVKSLEADLEQSRIFLKALDVKKFVAERDSLRKQNEELLADLEAYKEKYRKWHNIAQDICVVFGDSTYTYVAMEGWIKKMCDSDVADRYLDLAKNVCDRMLKIMPHEWDDPECGEQNKRFVKPKVGNSVYGKSFYLDNLRSMLKKTLKNLEVRYGELTEEEKGWFKNLDILQ